MAFNNEKTMILPFKPYCYNSEFVNFKDVTAPPYDVIDEKLQNDLYKRSEFNIIRLILGKEFVNDSEQNNRYTRASKFLNDWIANGILKLEQDNSIYIYVQNFIIEGNMLERIGFISLFVLPEEIDNKQNIFGHEKTLLKPKEDRFKLMNATKANLSSIFSIFEDNDNAVISDLLNALDNSPKKIAEFEDDNNVIHKLFKISDEDIIESIKSKMKNKSVYIADGHHRFETCLNFRNYVKKTGLSGISADLCMMYFAPANQKGLVILPTHRCIVNKKIDINKFIDSISGNFAIKEVNAENIINETKKTGASNTVSFGFAHNSGKYFILSLKDNIAKQEENPLEYLDVSILQNYIFKDIIKMDQGAIDKQKYIIYEKEASNALDKLKNKNIEAVFFMNPTKIEDVIKVASLNLRMPQKSTFFYPKIISGLTINIL